VGIGHDLGGHDLHIAVENGYPPFNLLDEASGEPVGWDYDACRAICALLNCNPVFVAVPHSRILGAVAAGTYDVAADGIIVTAERERMVDFSIPYMVIRQVALVRATETAIVDKLSLVSGSGAVGAPIGSIHEQTAADLVGPERVVRFDTVTLAVQALIGGDVDAVVVDDETAQALAAAYDAVRVIEQPLTGEDRLALAFPPGSNLVEPVNAAIRALQDDGTLAQLHARWWGTR
jgi:polar amino acid transport system substrate-binding protein